MSKKPVVPVKRPTKGRGKGNCRELKKLMKEVDSIAKGLKEVKGLKGLKGLKEVKGLKGGGLIDMLRGKKKVVNEVVASNGKTYYDKLKEFFEKQENIANIKRLKESLVIDVLTTMDEWFNSILNKTKILEDDIKGCIKIILGILFDINVLKQTHFDIFFEKNKLTNLPYIEKISSLVTINMLHKLYMTIKVTMSGENTNNADTTFKDIEFKFLNENKLIFNIQENLKNLQDTKLLEGLTKDVKNELNYYSHIFILRDYNKGNSDDTNVIQVIEWLKNKCISISKENDPNGSNNNIGQFITNNNKFITNNDKQFLISCNIEEFQNKFKKLENNFKKINEIIQEMKTLNNALKSVIDELKKNPIYEKCSVAFFLTTLLKGRLDELRENTENFETVLYNLYNYIIKYDDMMNDLKKLKEDYKSNVKEIYEFNVDDIGLPDVSLTLEKIDALRKESKINPTIISELEGHIKGYNSVIKDIKDELNRRGDVEKLIDENETVGLDNIVKLYNILCKRNKKDKDTYARIEGVIKANEAANVIKMEEDRKRKNDILQQELIAKAAADAAEEAEEDRIGTIEGVESTLKGLISNVVKNVKETKKNAQVLPAAPTVSSPLPTFKSLRNPFEEEDDGKPRKPLYGYYDDLPREELEGGKLTTKYISTGNFVYILYEKKRIKRCVYAKAKGRGKYCKIKGVYVLLSKLKVV